ncbi:YdbL family protein [Denitrificimonas sp. JX-1]|uniref:YdbL family protein n=1 Tax=Denitrificimonas halotolerans TaxID=3098930 RepID=A0ABU5GMK3_9GAMM|nr:YdbL family protein [Denitrificimonas sp. JX-1]MDY7218167.1 YdbL family protein [Denitrificimonas sp. JX-1]
MTFRKLLMPILLISSLLSTSVMAMDLNQAMNSLSQAKTAGLLGEQPNGYLGVVKAQGDAAEIARLINEARRTEYKRLANNNNLQLSDVETMAGKKALDKTAPGLYIQVNGRWLKK